MSCFFRSGPSAAAIAVLATAGGVRPAAGQASGTMQATVTVLAAAEPLDLSPHQSEHRPGETAPLLVARRTEYAEVAIEHPDPCAPRPPEPAPIRVTITYVR